MKPTGAAILVSRGIKVLQAAPAANPFRSAKESTRESMLFIGYDAAADPVQHLTLSANNTPQQAAAAMRAAGCDPNFIVTVSAAGGQPDMHLLLRLGADYQ